MGSYRLSSNLWCVLASFEALTIIVSQLLVPMNSLELEELSDALIYYFRLPVWAPRSLEGLSIYSESPRQVYSSFFVIRVTMVLSNFDFDASLVVFTGRVNYYYNASKYAQVVIFIVVCWSPQYHSSLEPG